LELSRVLSYNHREPKNTDINESLLFKDRSETDKWLVKNRIPALGIGYIKDGKIHDVVIFGKNEKGESNPKNLIFDVASLTKPITAMVALQLVNTGKWSLDEPIYKYWTDPDVADDHRSKTLTTRHILSHQSGFPNWRDSNLRFEFEPGTKYQYSGEGFEYLRKALQNKFKKPIDQLASELIFKPLNMKDTRFCWDSTMDESRYAKRHKGDGTVYETYKNKSANGANHLLTTIEDYSKFMIYVMNGAGLEKDLYQQMISQQVRIKPRKYFGLGWWVDENVNEGENAIVHGGDDKGVHTIAFILPQSKEGLLIFTNCDNGTDIYLPIIQHYLTKAAGQGIIDVETK
jgi:CubicO group peptidase (beta-lactamase class C family)